MKKIIFSVAIFSVFSTLVFGEEKILLMTGEWEPYTAEKMDGYGFFTEIVTAVFKEMGIRVEYKFRPWKRCEMNVKEGNVFAGFPYYETEERKRDFEFSDPVVNSCSRLFFLKSKFPKGITWEKFEDLKGHRIGGAFGNWYEPVFKSAGLEVDYSPTDDFSFKKLHVGRVDLVPTDELVGWEHIKKLFPNNIADFDTAKKPIKEDKLHLLVSKKYPGAGELKEKFNGSLKQIKEKGIYSEILKKYNVRE